MPEKTSFILIYQILLIIPCFFNENYGWFGNNIGNHFLSTNGGQYWLYTQNIINNANISYQFINQFTGWSVG